MPRESWKELATFSEQAGPLCRLQVELHARSVDQDNPTIHELLSRAIVGHIAAKRLIWKEELDRESLCRGRAWARAESHSGAEANTVKLLVTGKVSEHATNERRSEERRVGKECRSRW